MERGPPWRQIQNVIVTLRYVIGPRRGPVVSAGLPRSHAGPEHITIPCGMLRTCSLDLLVETARAAQASSAADCPSRLLSSQTITPRLSPHVVVPAGDSGVPAILGVFIRALPHGGPSESKGCSGRWHRSRARRYCILLPLAGASEHVISACFLRFAIPQDRNVSCSAAVIAQCPAVASIAQSPLIRSLRAPGHRERPGFPLIWWGSPGRADPIGTSPCRGANFST